MKSSLAVNPGIAAGPLSLAWWVRPQLPGDSRQVRLLGHHMTFPATDAGLSGQKYRFADRPR